MKKSIVLMCICAIMLMFSSCSKNSGTSHLTQEEKLMKTHIMTYFKKHVKSYNTIVIKYAEVTEDLLLQSLSNGESYPTNCEFIVTIAYAHGKKYYEDVDAMALTYIYFPNGDALFISPLESKYNWVLREGIMEWKTLWMEDK